MGIITLLTDKGTGLKKAKQAFGHSTDALAPHTVGPSQDGVLWAAVPSGDSASREGGRPGRRMSGTVGFVCPFNMGPGWGGAGGRDHVGLVAQAQREQLQWHKAQGGQIDEGDG